MTAAWILVAFLVAIALAAPRYGVDSRFCEPGDRAQVRRGGYRSE